MAPPGQSGKEGASSSSARFDTRGAGLPSDSRAETSSSGVPAPAQESQGTTEGAPKNKRRSSKKKRRRRKSFAVQGPPDPSGIREGQPSNAPEVPTARAAFYRLGNAGRSSTSLESEALLDHRDQEPHPPARRGSTQHGLVPNRSNSSINRPSPQRHTQSNPYPPSSHAKSRLFRSRRPSDDSEDGGGHSDDRTPLMSSMHEEDHNPRAENMYGSTLSATAGRFFRRSNSGTSARSGRKDLKPLVSRDSFASINDYDVNNPPSVPGSPTGASVPYEDTLFMGSPLGGSPSGRDTIIDIDGQPIDEHYDGPRSGSSSLRPGGRARRSTFAAEDDVCFPVEGMSVIGEEDEEQHLSDRPSKKPRRRRSRMWPDLRILEEWNEEEREQQTMGDIRARKVSEPLMVNGRLRPQKVAWHREDSEVPYRWTYFNPEFQSTIHSQTISELLQEGQSFRDLFIPEPPAEESSTDEEAEEEQHTSPRPSMGATTSPFRGSAAPSRTSARVSESKQASSSGEQTRSSTPTPLHKQLARARPDAQRPVFWLDVLSPTETEMRVLQRTFGIHPLTAEDIMMQEAREKVELFRNYYFVNYRTFEQDTNSDEYMDPINMYAVIFREGVITFHFSLTPHPANVRRRIRQLSDYLVLSSDWISYAIIDDITDAYAPLVQRIEEEVDEIDDKILLLHTKMGGDNDSSNGSIMSGRARPRSTRGGVDYEKISNASTEPSGESVGGDMLRRVGECRKKVMSLYRLLGNKADVIKGFAKRCNEHNSVAPRSEIGLYLGDIQDHIVTMTGNLSHYENLLSRAHGNYLAQINIQMNERSEKTTDVLNKLTVLGTIVLPMNIVTGMWGMNVLVPGQDIDTLWWFWGITSFLVVFGLTSFFIAKRMFGIV